MKESSKKAAPRHSKPRHHHTKPETGAGRILPDLASSAFKAGKKSTFVSIVAIVVLLSACLLPFSDKAFNIDDPLFVWTADHILNHPADFYGFRLNWFGFEASAYELQKNPPLISYYIALVKTLCGSGERALHLAFFFPALATALGIYFLAKLYCRRPLEAAFISIMTPAFLVSGNTIMSDVTMLCFWVWAVYFWIRGVEEKRRACLMISAVFVSLSTLSKYYGVSLVPLLAFYTVHRARSFDRRILYLAVPLLLLGLYCWITYKLYGYAHFLEIFSYSKESRNFLSKDYLSDSVIGLAFVGGGFLTFLFYWPFLWKRASIAWLVVAALFSAFLSIMPAIGQFPLKGNEGFGLYSILQAAVYTTVGLSILFLAISDFMRSRDSLSWLLFLWVSGTLFFSFYLNWTVNIRTILPIAPAVGILVMRRMESRFRWPALTYARRIGVPLLLSVILSISVVWADYSLANADKRAAREIAKKYAGADRADLWFQGHWGFQYYMEKFGGKPVDFKNYRMNGGDILVTPSLLQNTNVNPRPVKFLDPLEQLEFEACKWISIMNNGTGTGFYGSSGGPVPFVFGPSPPQIYTIDRLRLTIRN